ncbi:S8 family serine peptidase [Mycoplasmopsis bovirhinis]|uniref:Peptidase S8/S53 domain-containing protein n=1 Tax=Mycoplasmopsis bovirhinis TaxID=29553 RepID=A0A449AE47_9BACT|nr:S8 family serine peptidase [Mycoplasmopsis bovirhinis]VEU63260.1 Uncharacterised protein [Mycoplasmopsis bovirhinis]
MFKKVRNIFFGATSVLTILPLVSVSSNKLLIAENNNKKIQYINLNSAYVKAQAEESDEGRTINLGANRLEIFVRLTQTQLDKITKFINHNTGKDVPILYHEFSGVLSIAYIKSIDNNKLNDLVLNFFKDNNIEYTNIYSFNTNTYYDNFKIQKENGKITKGQAYVSPRQDYSHFEHEYDNEWLFSFLGLDKKTRKEHFNNYINSKVNIGVLESGGVVETDSDAFTWNKKYGNGVSWRNELFYYESWSRHATQVAELIAGKKGINQTLGIISVELNLFWTGITGELNYLLGHTNIVNNSWSLDSTGLAWNRGLYNYLDNLIFNNPELINIFSAGNGFDKGKKEIDGVQLSKNSIIIGATDNYNLEKKSGYSQIGNNKNFISVVAPGGYYRFTDRNKYKDNNGNWVTRGYTNIGTSFSAPVISTIAGMLKQKYKWHFDLGSDSIIFKSALISGSRRPKEIQSIYTPETGYGIPQYDKIQEAMRSLIVLKKTDKNPDVGQNSRKVYFSAGEKVRATLAFLYNGSNDSTDIDFMVKTKDGNVLVSGINGDRNAEVVEFVAPYSGLYTFEAYTYKTTRKNVEVAITYVTEDQKKNLKI